MSAACDVAVLSRCFGRDQEIVPPATIGGVAWWSLAQLLGLPGTACIAAAGVVMCFALWGCTGMIYACLRFLREWAHWLTLLNFVLLGWMSGATLFAAYWHALYGATEARFGVMAALTLTLAAAVARLASLARNCNLKPLSTTQSAIDVRTAKLVQMSQGATGTAACRNRASSAPVRRLQASIAKGKWA